MALQEKPTRDESTKQKYKKRTQELIRRCRKDLQISVYDQLDLRQFVGWLISRKTEWSRPTWRFYKSSVVYFLEKEIEESGKHEVAEEALELLLEHGVEGCVKKTEKTSGKKLKKFPVKDFYKLHTYLSEHEGRWHEPLRRWLISGLLTGLRPQEWANTTYTNALGEEALIVKNAKATNGRAHGPTRTILLGGLSDEERNIIKTHVERANEWQEHDQYQYFYNACANTLGRLSRSIWPRRPQHVSLYSARHQFSADAKASGLSREEIAALMGHAVDDTATKHYGKKTAGATLVMVKPDPAEVNKIRSTYHNRFSGENEIRPGINVKSKTNPLKGSNAGKGKSKE